MSPKNGRAAQSAAATVHATLEPVVLNAFRRITQALRLAAAQTQTETGISAAQLFVLTRLDQEGPHSIKDLAEATMTDRSSVADVVDRLAARRLVSRRSSREDARRAEVHITPAGRRLLSRAPEAPTAILMEGIGGLADEELRALALGLNRLCEEMGLEDGQPAMLFEPVKEKARRRMTR